MNNSKKRRVASSVAACALVAALGLGGTLAYLTDAETVTNTFTVGDVKIELLEPTYPGNDNENEVEDLVPNEEIDKDPKVANVGVNDTIIFMTVDSPMEFITLVNDDGTPVNMQNKNYMIADKSADDGAAATQAEQQVAQAKVQEIFWFKDAADTASSHANNFDDNWTELPNREMYVIKDADGNETLIATVTNDYASDKYNFEDPDTDKTVDSTEKVSVNFNSKWIEELKSTISASSETYALEDGSQDNDLVLDKLARYTKNQNDITGKNIDGSLSGGTKNGLSDLQFVLQKAYENLPSGSAIYKRYVFAYNTDIQGSTTKDDDGLRENAKLEGHTDDHQAEVGAVSNRETSNLFDKIQLKNFIENEIDKTTQNIEIRAYAIQADEILEASDEIASTEGVMDLNAAELEHVYDIFVRQNSRDYDNSGMKVIGLRNADSLKNQNEGEATRTATGGFSDPIITHVNRWNTTADVVSPDKNDINVATDPANAQTIEPGQVTDDAGSSQNSGSTQP